MRGVMRVGRDQLASILEFVAPGLLHSLGNQLFAIQGNAQVLGIKEEDIARERSAILSAARAAQESLDIFRCLTGESPERDKAQAGLLLRRVCDASKVPLRDAGLRCILEHSSIETPVLVESTLLTRCVLETIRCIREELPSGFDGDLHVDLSSQGSRQLEIGFEVQQKPSLLPFPLDLDAVLRRAEALVTSLAAELRRTDESGKLLLLLPLDPD